MMILVTRSPEQLEAFELETVGTSSLYLFQTGRPSRWAPDDVIVLESA